MTGDSTRKEGAALELSIEALVKGRQSDPFSILGPHPWTGGDGTQGTAIRVFHPGADGAVVLPGEGNPAGFRLVKTHPEGFFCGFVPGALEGAYRLRLEKEGHSWEIDDPYRFGPLIGPMDIYFFAEGTHQHLDRMLGAHPMEIDGVQGTRFAVWAPNAKRVSVVGDFNQWDGRRHPMRLRQESGVWELFLPGIRAGAIYKYELIGAHGQPLPLKADPYAKRTEVPPLTASIVHVPDTRVFADRNLNDRAWMEERGRRAARDQPMSVYEVHLGSWMRIPEEGDRPLTYDELGDRLIPYAREMGFTHLEFLPITEHPFDGSWGYQPLGLFAPTVRYGSPEDFARFIARCHKANLGVYLDWVPAHFPNDPHGLARFDGTAVYEHADPRQGFHQDWNTLIYNYGRREVANFLLASALFWLRDYHMDGLRVDAVASMLYLDYSREQGQWIPNKYGGNENLEATAFIKNLNTVLYRECPGAVTIAEESTAWPAVSRPVDGGGLGFAYKCYMGWINDTLRYMSREPVHRRFHHHDMTFGLLYAFSENFILPLSHDEVVHGKGSLLQRMPGDRWQKFANLRAYYTYMWAHPGKKLLFMGGEFAQAREWDHQTSLDWHLMSDPSHGGIRTLITDLNAAYKSVPALHQLDCEAHGFEWVVADDSANSVLAFLRYGHDRSHPVLAVFNFTPVPRHFYRLGVPIEGPWREILNSDSTFYGGSNQGNHGLIHADHNPMHNRAYSLSLNLPPLSGVLLTPARD